MLNSFPNNFDSQSYDDEWPECRYVHTRDSRAHTYGQCSYHGTGAATTTQSRSTQICYKIPILDDVDGLHTGTSAQS